MSEHRSLILELAEVIDRHLSHRHASRAKGEPRPPRSRGPPHWLIRLLVPNLGTIIVVVILLFTFPTLAAPLRAPATVSTSGISYQGRLADADGNPITGKVNMELRIYDVPTGGTPLWEEYRTGGNAVDVSDGLFNVMLGSINNTLAEAIAGHDELYLGITVGTDSEMEPRVQLGSVPFSMIAEASNRLLSLHSYEFWRKEQAVLLGGADPLMHLAHDAHHRQRFSSCLLSRYTACSRRRTSGLGSRS